MTNKYINGLILSKPRNQTYADFESYGIPIYYMFMPGLDYTRYRSMRLLIDYTEEDMIYYKLSGFDIRNVTDNIENNWNREYLYFKDGKYLGDLYIMGILNYDTC